MSIFTLSNYDEIILFIFLLYNFEQDNKISKDDIRIVLYYITLNSHKFIFTNQYNCYIYFGGFIK